jgi:hypothetical protein
MKTTSTKLLAMGFGAAALCATALPAAAGSFTQPGGTMGAPAGANPPPGLYFVNAANYGSGDLAGAAIKTGEDVGVEVPIFIFVPGWNFLGASYAASVAFPFVDVGIRAPVGVYLGSIFNPYVNPITLSWNLGNGVFASIGEGIYIPMDQEVNGSNTPTGATSAAAFETRVALSYLGNDWVASANGILGIATKDSLGTRAPDYVNVDLTLAHHFGKWELGVVGYGAFDINGGAGTVGFNNSAAGKGEQLGVGGLLGYNFGPVDLTIEATHQFVTEGAANYGKNDTRVWTVLVIPIWNPAPPPRPVIAKY